VAAIKHDAGTVHRPGASRKKSCDLAPVDQYIQEKCAFTILSGAGGRVEDQFRRHPGRCQ
jgi:hypothetical protein